MNKLFVSCLLWLVSVHISFAQTKEIMELRSWREKNENRLLSEYLSFLSIPNLASDTVSLAKNATTIMKMMEASGIDHVQQLRSPSPGVAPVVYGEVKTPGATETLVFYAHYDGQPVNPANWSTGLSPFVPTIGNGPLGDQFKILPVPDASTKINPDWRIFARGASDDKAGVMAILTAYRAMVASSLKPTVNIKFFFEGEEEAGSPHLQEIITAHKELLRSDLWIICDGPVHQSGRKSIVFGVRGDANMELTLFGAKKPLHSGHYGNWVSNPAWQLVQLLSSMKNEKGEVTIAGFYDDVIPLSKAEKDALANLPSIEEQMKMELGIKDPERASLSLYGSYNLPSLNINGIKSADVGSLSANVIPVKAVASLDLRLVAGNDWKRQQEKVISHIKSKGYHVVEKPPTDEEREKYARLIQVDMKKGYNAQKTRMDLPAAKKIISAVQTTTNDPLVLIPTAGGSLPLFLFEKYLGAVTITVPLANHDNNQHAENENIRIRNLWNGIETMASIMMMK